MITAAAGVQLDRAAVVVLRELLVTGAIRMGDLADALRVDASHITRQVQKLTRAAYVERLHDPSDNRAQIIILTSSGKAAAMQVSTQARFRIATALAHWAPSDLHQFATLLDRALDDLAALSDPDPSPGIPGGSPSDDRRTST